jgi:3-deoxy-D-manno-octulosonate 8-phosphate phosphatase (KDO 8-P phosphatase)
MFKLLILDVDGVMTDGTKVYGDSGAAHFKSFCDRDFTAIKRFRTAGINTVWLSGDRNINETIALKRQIPFYLSVNYNKPEVLKDIEKDYSISRSDMAYVGDDWYDWEVLQLVGFPLCTNVAPQKLQNYCKIIPRKGGDGVVAWLYDHYMETLI